MRARPCPAATANGSSGCVATSRAPAQERLELTADGQKAGRVLEGKTYDAMPGTALTVPSRAYR
jgi:hypothetical protein